MRCGHAPSTKVESGRVKGVVKIERAREISDGAVKNSQCLEIFALRKTAVPLSIVLLDARSGPLRYLLRRLDAVLNRPAPS